MKATRTINALAMLTLAIWIVISGCSNEASTILGNDTNDARQTSKNTITAVQTSYKGRFKINTYSTGAVEVYDKNANNKWLASYTVNCYTVSLDGASRTLTEDNVSVTHSVWVRTLPAKFTGDVDTTWLSKALAANTTNTSSPDILGIAMEYIAGGSKDAMYGPTSGNTYSEGSDFHDYLQVNRSYYPYWSSTLNKYLNNPYLDTFEVARANRMDCSGFMRMIWGYRHSFAGKNYTDTIPLCVNVGTNDGGVKMPRKSFTIEASAPGVMVFSGHTISTTTNLPKLKIGDLVFFDADAGDGTQIDHVGMYIGKQANGNYRFISSRKSNNVGPTFNSDGNGKSILNNDGTGQYLGYANSFRSARRM